MKICLLKGEIGDGRRQGKSFMRIAERAKGDENAL